LQVLFVYGDPQLPHNSDHRQNNEARRNKYLVSLSTGDAWPGKCAFTDFLNPSCRYNMASWEQLSAPFFKQHHFS